MREAAGEKEFTPYTGCGDQGKVTSDREGLWASGQTAGVCLESHGRCQS